MTDGVAGATALVTGSTAGIGRAVAEHLARLGADVIIHGRNPERAAETVAEIEKDSGRARFVTADLSRADDVRRLADQAGAVDILVNNAGIFEFAPTVDTVDDLFDRHINVNVRAPYILVQKLVPGMIDRGYGAIVNVSSVVATHPQINAGIYGATKAALELLTKHWADEFGGTGVRVNAAAAGPTDTLGTAGAPDFIAGMGRATTLGRTARPEEIANAVVFLATPASSYVNGSVFPVFGGERALAPI
ncbi:SDR family NAD(P)-dependent oxidoreductase [Mycobacteroides abscessus]|uniref:SDR family NAD(P)-dependent oxidoreductase n=1 Tax=Mycobacteroides abscessus TaxID=36809 RepID=UPI00092658FE|nr:SDR family oxidoreductase [Mycobacteroides abscessus]SHQ39649.1 short-chain dehydrogenase of uncharacterised substrate specificity [Mycobacteroides abscessus subsp. abscessus]